MNLVAGATGSVGSGIVLSLLAHGKPARALVRSTSDPQKVQRLRDAGAEIAIGDLKSRRSLDAACSGVKTVISTASSTVSRGEGDSIETVDGNGQLALVDAAAAAGAAHFILVSFPDMGLEFPLQTAKRSVEARIRASGMGWTIVQPTFFMEAWLGPHLGFDPANGHVRIFGDGEEPTSWISAADVVRFVVACVDDDRVKATLMPIGGPEALSPNEVVRIFEEMRGEPLTVEHVPAEAIRSQYSTAADSMQQSLAGLMLGYNGGQPIDMTEPLRLFPMELTSVRAYARRMLGS